MASIVRIANMALAQLGDEGELTSLTEDTRAARAVNDCFDEMRDLLLRAHPWDFARARAQLPALAAAPVWGGWTAFQKPADFLRFVELDADRRYLLEGQTILARQKGPLNLLYIRRVTDSGAFDPLFTDALAARIAMQVAVKITGSTTAQEAAEARYQRALAEARRVNGQEDRPRSLPDDDWLLARNA